MTELACQNWLRAQHGALLPELPDALWCNHVPAVATMATYLPHLPRPLVEQDTTVTTAMRQLGGYEAFIEHHNAIPTRADNWHDWYNAMCWHLFPKTKEALHRSQIQYPAGPTAKNGRSPQQNGATLFDENGIVVVTQAGWVIEALRQHQWQELFVQRREELIQVATLWVVGHAMWEQLRHPFCGLTAKWLAVDLSATARLAAVDHLASLLPPVVPPTLGNLPVLGWPGICTANADRAFYDNTDYFRPARRLKS
jgi:hypothetical protein